MNVDAQPLDNDLVSISKVQAHAFATERELTILSEYDAEHGWKRGWLDPCKLRNLYGHIGPFEAKKGETIFEMAQRIEPDSASDEADFASKVLAERREKAVVVYESTNGNLYVGDGNKRALNACLHKEDRIEAIVVAVLVEDWA